MAHWSLEPAVLEAYGFAVDPDVGLKLSGAPEHESAEVSISLHSALPAVQTGNLALTVPMHVKNGAPMLLTLKANVVMPAVALLTDSISFGSV